MTGSARRNLVLAAAALLWLAGDAAATPSLDGCTGYLDPVPGQAYPMQQVITQPGTWCLRQDLVVEYAAPGALVEIVADDVVIDCRGHRIERAPDGGHTAAIYAQYLGPARAVVRNCRIEGFGAGIALGTTSQGGGGHVVEDNVLAGNQNGIEVGGSGSVVRRNRIHGTTYGNAITAYGPAEISGNLVDGIHAQFGHEGGIVVVNPRGTLIVDNVVRGLRRAPTANGPAIAVRIIEQTLYQVPHAGASIRGNVFLGGEPGGGLFMECTDFTSRYADNVVGGLEESTFNRCVDAGENDVTP
jgi:nitrous oxidase accessory protein NosD